MEKETVDGFLAEDGENTTLFRVAVDGSLEVLDHVALGRPIILVFLMTFQKVKVGEDEVSFRFVTEIKIPVEYRNYSLVHVMKYRIHVP